MGKKKIKALTGEPKLAKGRPTKYSLELASKLCERMAKGEPLTLICKDEEMPSVDTVYSWLYSDQSFADQYIRARDRQAETYADQTVGIVEEFIQESKKRSLHKDENDRIRVLAEGVKMQILARQWYAGKIKPKKYSEKPVIEDAKDEKVDDVRAIEKVKDLLSAVQARVITESVKQ